MEQKKLLILGSDFCTLRVVQEAHARGLYVIVADLMETSPTKAEADEAWLISTTELERLEQKCREVGVGAVLFGASDFNVSNARLLCGRLGLPIYCRDDEAWTTVRNKAAFKRLCREVGALVAQDYTLSEQPSEAELATIPLPVVVKPADQSGNRGMSYCRDRGELAAGLRHAREVSSGEIIVERMLHGTEYNVHYALADGEATLLYFSATHHQKGQPENIYSFKCTTAAHLKQYLQEVNALVMQVIKRAGCREGIAWVDVMRDEDGCFYLLEMGHRFGGVMTYVPYERVSGFNTVGWMLDCALGIRHTAGDLPQIQPCYTACAASYHLFTARGGKVAAVRGLEEISSLPNVTVDMPKRVGCTVRERACMGLLGIYGKDVEEICHTVRQINARLRIENETGENMVILFDGLDDIRREYEQGIKELCGTVME